MASEASDSSPVPTRPKVEVRRSARRRRTVTAYRERDTIVVLIPGRMSRTRREAVRRRHGATGAGPGGAGRGAVG